MGSGRKFYAIFTVRVVDFYGEVEKEVKFKKRKQADLSLQTCITLSDGID